MLKKCDYRPKLAIVMILCDIDVEDAKALSEELGKEVLAMIDKMM